MPVIDTDTAEGKASLQALIDAETKGLKDKNAELISDQKKVRDSMKEIQTQLDEIKAAKESAEADAAEKSGDVERVKAALAVKHQKEMDTLKGQLDQSNSRLNQTLIDKGLSDALVKNNVAAQHLPAVTALIKATAKSEITDVDGNAVATFDGKPIDDFVTSWAQGDIGKHYIAAPQNGGGGSQGSNGGGKAPAGATRSTMSHTQKAAYITEHGQEAYLALPA